MMSVEIEPQYLAHDEDVENGNDYRCQERSCFHLHSPD